MNAKQNMHTNQSDGLYTHSCCQICNTKLWL